MKRRRYLGLLTVAFLALPAVGALAYYGEDTSAPVTEISTPDGAVVFAAEDLIEGTSTDDMSGVYNVVVDFCSTDDATECKSMEDFGSDCYGGCPLAYDWEVVVPEELPPGQYTVIAYAVDDAGNWEYDGPSILVTVV